MNLTLRCGFSWCDSRKECAKTGRDQHALSRGHHMLHLLLLFPGLPELQLRTRGETAPGQDLLIWLVLVWAEKLIWGFDSVHLLLLEQASVRHWDLLGVQYPSAFWFRTAVRLFTNYLKTTLQIQASQLLVLILVLTAALLGFEVCTLLSPMTAYIQSFSEVWEVALHTSTFAQVSNPVGCRDGTVYLCTIPRKQRFNQPQTFSLGYFPASSWIRELDGLQERSTRCWSDYSQNFIII